MYLARKRKKGVLHYAIRETYEDGDCLRSRHLFDLGTDPGRYVVYPGGNAYYVHEEVEDTVRSLGPEGPVYEQLEQIFWFFLKPEIKHAVEHFRHRETEARKARSAGNRPDGSDFHLFDKRRAHFLRFGQMDQGRIHAVPHSIFKALHHKSRDELEQYFLENEAILRPHERKAYIYVIFDIQRFFTELIAREMPQGLDPAAVDDRFIEEICRLNRDDRFWAGMDGHDAGRLHDYLVRYVIMYFDNDYGRSPWLADYIRQFMDSRRHYAPPPPRTTVSTAEAVSIFGIGKEEVHSMNRRTLSRLYRKKAREFHPDQGGDSQLFIKLTEAYQTLLKRKA